MDINFILMKYFNVYNQFMYFKWTLIAILWNIILMFKIIIHVIQMDIVHFNLKLFYCLRS